MRTANPALNEKVFTQYPRLAVGEAMTIEGTVNKTGLLLLVVMLAAFYTWGRFTAGQTQLVNILMLGGVLGGLIMALVTAFKPAWSPMTAPIYAALEGLFLGGISAFANRYYPGVVFQAVLLTFGVAFSLLAAYRSGLIRATENFKLGLAAATGGILFIYLVSFALSFFGWRIPFIHQSGLIGIGFSMFVVVIAALNLVLDFDFIEQGAAQGAPGFMEWYGAFGLMVTLVWLYIEILNLLMKLQGGSRE